MEKSPFSSLWARCLWLLTACLLSGCGGGAKLSPAEAPSSEPAAVNESGNYGYSAEADSADESLLSGPVSASESTTSLNKKQDRRGPSRQRPAVASPELGMPAGDAKSRAAPPPPPEPDKGATPVSIARSAERAPLLIYRATVTMAVFGLDTALNAVEELARGRSGYLVQRSDTSITIRVPAPAFQETLVGVGKLGDELHRDVSAQDVTEHYADLEIRLRNAEVVRQRLEVLLAKANSVEDALAVERELARVTESIEQLKGKLKLLGELVAFSTITVNFQPRGVEHVNAQAPLPFEWLGELGLSNLLQL